MSDIRLSLFENSIFGLNTSVFIGGFFLICVSASISKFFRLVLPSSSVLCFFYLYLILLHVFSCNITPHQFRSSYLSMSTDLHFLIAKSSSVFLSTRPNHLSRYSHFVTSYVLPGRVSLMISQWIICIFVIKVCMLIDIQIKI